MARFYSESFVEKVIDACDIVTLVSRHTSLSKRGSRYVGLCPFHSEKTPSFNVDEEKKLYYCFGCQKGGNVVGFVMDILNCPFPEAIEHLAEASGIPLEEGGASPQGQAPGYSKKKRIYELNKHAARYFFSQIKKNSQALSYIKNRGISINTVRDFAIGYAPPGSGLAAYLRSEAGATDAELIEAYLARKTRNGLMDCFQNRLMFPIQDLSGNVVAFGGRAFGEGQPKYLNSSETLVFKKNSVLFNLGRAKKELANSPLIIVEGYMDVIGLYEQGIKSACATLGTALGEGHATLVARASENVALCYDGDNAGKNAAIRGASVLASAGVLPKVALLPDGEDPDSYVLKYGKDAFLSLVENSSNAADFTLSTLAGRYDMSQLAQASAFVREAVKGAGKYSDPLARDYYIKRIAFLSGSEIATVREMAKEPAAAAPKDENLQNAPMAAIDLAESKLFAFIIDSRNNWEVFVENGGDPSLFSNQEIVEAAKTACSAYLSTSIDNARFLVYNNTIAYIVSKIHADNLIMTSKDAISCIKSLIIVQYEKEMMLIKAQLEEAQQSSDLKKASMLLTEYSLFKKKLLEQKLGGAK
ncbi:MAG: DNA primase [Eubacteriaceae bacterium]|nr:DNA primase [Eubacteriaceae bacterium]